AEFLSTGQTPIGIDVEGHGRAEELAADVDLSRTVGWFTTKYPVSLAVGGLSWAQVLAGEAALGAVIKDAKEQLRALPDPLTYGLLRYLNPDVDLPDSGPLLHATWTWARSALDRTQISRLAQLWFDALTGICAHVRDGGGGLTPSDIAPARLTQHQLDALHQQYAIADVLPLTPLQEGLLFHASITKASDDVYAVQLAFTVTGPLEYYRLRGAVLAVVTR